MVSDFGKGVVNIGYLRCTILIVGTYFSIYIFRLILIIVDSSYGKV